jgi:ribonucleoside-diphosphate reductase alpha chain
MEQEKQILSDIVVFNKYAKWMPSLGRRETYQELITRYETMMLERYPSLESEIRTAMKLVAEKQILPSMRGLQFAGAAIEKNESRIYNCAYLPIESYWAFSETMQLLLGGTGVGFSVRKAHVAQLPAVVHPKYVQKFIIEDSIEGWSDAVKHLMKSYFGLRKTKPRFDYSAIRAKGERLVTAGGKAPGPEPLRKCLTLIEDLLLSVPEGSQLTTVQCHDIECYIADAVLSGGIRRAALISLFDYDDIGMLTAKSGNWWELNPQRGRANNSVAFNRNTVTEEQFYTVWKQVEASGSGEPGVFFTNDDEWGTNPLTFVSLH